MIYAFADCVLDTHFYMVARARQSLPLRPKVFQLLHYLLEHRDRIIPGTSCVRRSGRSNLSATQRWTARCGRCAG